jgi:antitoxin HigA-1
MVTMTRVPTQRARTHPGAMIREEFLLPLGMTQTELAERLGVAWARVNQLVNGKRGGTPDTASPLERLFDPPAEFWPTLQPRRDLCQAMQAPGAKAIVRMRPAARDPGGRPAVTNG